MVVFPHRSHYQEMALPYHRHSCVLDKSSHVYHLAGVKDTLYHPRLPTLRRMEMDSMVHKLSDEHSRTSTPCDHSERPTILLPLYTNP